jgi:hypothetical protein
VARALGSGRLGVAPSCACSARAELSVHPAPRAFALKRGAEGGAHGGGGGDRVTEQGLGHRDGSLSLRLVAALLRLLLPLQ